MAALLLLSTALFSTSRSGKFALFCDLCIESKQHVRTPGPLLGIASSPRYSS